MPLARIRAGAPSKAPIQPGRVRTADRKHARPANARPGDRVVIEKVTHRPRQGTGLLTVEVVSTAVELPEHDPFDKLRECSTMRGGNDCVTISPADGDGRELGEFVSPLEECTTLATPVDHVPHGSRERAR